MISCVRTCDVLLFGVCGLYFGVFFGLDCVFACLRCFTRWNGCGEIAGLCFVSFRGAEIGSVCGAFVVLVFAGGLLFWVCLIFGTLGFGVFVLVITFDFVFDVWLFI